MRKSLVACILIIMLLTVGCAQQEMETPTSTPTLPQPTPTPPPSLLPTPTPTPTPVPSPEPPAVTTQPSETKPPELPDLVCLEKPAMEPLAPIVGDRFHIKQTLKNVGVVATPSEFEIEISVQINKGDTRVFEQLILVNVQTPVKPGENRVVDIIPEYAIPEPGDYKAVLVLDPKKVAMEPREDLHVSESDWVQVPDLSGQVSFVKEPDAPALAQAEKDIEKSRKGDVTVTVVDASGQPRSGLSVQYAQMSSSFLFGASYPRVDSRSWSFMKEAGINYATMTFSWRSTEPNPGVFRLGPREPSPSKKIDFLRHFGFAGLGHNLMLAPWAGSNPDYVVNSSFEEYKRMVYPHVYEVVSAYKDDVKIWNVCNEPLNENFFLTLTSTQIIEIIKEGTRAIRDADPTARILINGSNEMHGVALYAFLEEAIQANVDFDIIGLQLTYNIYTMSLNSWGNHSEFPRRTLTSMAEMIDKYSTLGKKIAITAFSGQSESTETMKGYWGQPWSQDLQAEYLKAGYTLFYSKPQVESITWWYTTDAPPLAPFTYHCSLLDEKNQPKKSYYALKQLIRSWTTSGTAVTDANGQVGFRGFGGIYEVTVTDPKTDLSKKQEFQVQEQLSNSLTIKLDN